MRWVYIFKARKKIVVNIIMTINARCFNDDV
jgi:hypothetical protein